MFNVETLWTLWLFTIHSRLISWLLSFLQPNLYPTVGLQTPGEVVDANFGQHPFVFDIEDYMREWRTKIQAQIECCPIGEREGEWQAMIQKWVSPWCWGWIKIMSIISRLLKRLKDPNFKAESNDEIWIQFQSIVYLSLLLPHNLFYQEIQLGSGIRSTHSVLLLLIFIHFIYDKCDLSRYWALLCIGRMVASYLVHHSYCATAEAFAKSTDQAVHEELASIKNRQSEFVHILYMVNVTKCIGMASFWGFLFNRLELQLRFIHIYS